MGVHPVRRKRPKALREVTGPARREKPWFHGLDAQGAAYVSLRRRWTMLKSVLGALVGAAVALMIAPKSGEEFREELSDQLNDSIERGKGMARKVSRRAR